MLRRMVTDDKKRKARSKRLLRVYGITADTYDRLFAEQGGVCKICKTPPKAGRTHYVDHVHLKGGGGEIRGILCFVCNKRRIGREKDPAIFDACAEYLRGGTGYFTPLTKRRRKKKRQRR